MSQALQPRRALLRLVRVSSLRHPQQPRHHVRPGHHALRSQQVLLHSKAVSPNQQQPGPPFQQQAALPTTFG